MRMENGDNGRYVVVGSRPWNRRIFDEVISAYPGDWHFIAGRGDLKVEAIRSLNPRYIFFLHWSWKVPDEIVDSFECVGFHMTDLPFGRGGSPLQNLVIRGLKRTVLTALRLVGEIDGGPIYLKEDLGLEGSAEEIYLRADRLSAAMIKTIISRQPVPVPQSGSAVTFRRRTPAESVIPATSSLIELHDFIRMLDAEGYPRAFLVHHDYQYEFSDATLHPGKIVVSVTITPKGKTKK